MHKNSKNSKIFRSIQYSWMFFYDGENQISGKTRNLRATKILKIHFFLIYLFLNDSKSISTKFIGRFSDIWNFRRLLVLRKTQFEKLTSHKCNVHSNKKRIKSTADKSALWALIVSPHSMTHRPASTTIKFRFLSSENVFLKFLF